MSSWERKVTDDLNLSADLANAETWTVRGV